jgi:tetratricopeptide (TPR) repeat protein
MRSLLSGLLRDLWRRGRHGPATERALEQALATERAGDRRAARRAYERVLHHDPAHALAHQRLGALCGQDEDYESALAHLRRAVALDPQARDAHVDLGNVHRLRKDTDAAAFHYRAAIAIDPGCALAHYNLGLMLKGLQRFEEALPSLARASALLPDSKEVRRDYAYCLIEVMRFDEATTMLEQQLRAAPEDRELRTMLGFAYQKKQDPQVAREHYQAALDLGGDVVEVHNNLGIVLQDLGRIDEAMAHYDRTLSLQPDFSIATFHRALARLLRHDFGGWQDYEKRLLTEDHQRRSAAYPRWDGSPLREGTLLVFGEQGLGDEIMFASCLPDVMRDVRHCVVECAPKLETLFRRSFPAATVYASTPDLSVPAAIRALGIDREVPAGSLPLYYRASAQAFPEHAGYLKADIERTRRWRARLSALGRGFNVGISWRGGTLRTRRPLRSIPLERWAPVVQAPNARFISLQYDAADAELKELEALAQRQGSRFMHWPEAVADYEETAALVSALDLVVSVCTAVIHLGGALGRPVWVMAPYSPEWRYGFSGSGMPWYPSVRMFRQAEFGAWDPVVARVALELRAAAAGGA